MTTTLTPPPAGTVPGQGPRSPGSPRGSARAIAIVAIVAGALVLLGAALNGVLSTLHSASHRSQTHSANATGVTGLRIDADAADMVVRYGDGAEATLEVRDDGRGRWTLERDGSILRVSSPNGTQLGWSRGVSRVTLTLPESLRATALDADISLDAGEFEADGRFGDLTATVGGGRLQLAGSAERLGLRVDAGDARVDLTGVSRASFEVSAGRTVASLTGRAPDSVDIDTSAGAVELTLPVGSYDVRSDVAAGVLDNTLSTSPDSQKRVTVSVAAGAVTLRQ